jgi:chorismate-pyruvate lyase
MRDRPLEATAAPALPIAIGPGVLPSALEGAKPPPWAALLGHFYKRLGLSLPSIVRLEAPQLPPPYRQLLAHNDDMTPTLEGFYHESLSLQVCSRECWMDAYLREVVLALVHRGTPVEYGAIHIHLNHFPERVREQFLAEKHPFGRILQTEAIAHLGWPQAFFCIASDGRMGRLLDFDKPQLLYGRRNVLLDGQRRLLAEVIEILAPLPAGATPP